MSTRRSVCIVKGFHVWQELTGSGNFEISIYADSGELTREDLKLIKDQIASFLRRTENEDEQ